MNAFVPQQRAAHPPAATHTYLDCERRIRTPVIEAALTPDALIAHGPPCTTGRAVVIADADVWRRLEPSLGAVFHAAYRDVRVVGVTGEEACKSLDSLHHVLAHLTMLQVARRGDALFALGGGTVLDLAGFAGSIFRRGVPLTKIPTSLMAQVDAAISLKNAVNLGRCKNLVGTFTPPYSVLVDFRFLDTLPARHFSNGMAEIIKLALMVDGPLVQALAAVGRRAAVSDETLRDIFRRAIAGMVGQLNDNPYELNLRRAVDFGHWLSPQLEMADPALLHGEAVAIDMAISVTVSLQRGLLSTADWALALGLLSSWHLPVSHEAVDAALVTDSLQRTVQHRGGAQNIPMCSGLGAHRFVDDLRCEEVLHAHRLLASTGLAFRGGDIARHAVPSHSTA